MFSVDAVDFWNLCIHKDVFLNVKIMHVGGDVLYHVPVRQGNTIWQIQLKRKIYVFEKTIRCQKPTQSLSQD